MYTDGIAGTKRRASRRVRRYADEKVGPVTLQSCFMRVSPQAARKAANDIESIVACGSIKDHIVFCVHPTAADDHGVEWANAYRRWCESPTVRRAAVRALKSDVIGHDSHSAYLDTVLSDGVVSRYTRIAYDGSSCGKIRMMLDATFTDGVWRSDA